MTDLIHQLIIDSAAKNPQAVALRYRGRGLSYVELQGQMERCCQALLGVDVARGDRIAVYLEKRFEAVAAMFGASLAGLVFVPVNPLLKAAQVAYQLNDCQVKVLITSAQRFDAILPALSQCPNLRRVIVTDAPEKFAIGIKNQIEAALGFQVIRWEDMLPTSGGHVRHRCIDQDMAAILYTSGSTGNPKGVVLSHRNLVAGATSVAEYLHNTAQDKILCALPLSFDYGLSQLTTAFLTGATAVLLNYLLPRDILDAVASERITGLAAIPPLWLQLAGMQWPDASSLRYITNSGGTMPTPLLKQLRITLPETDIYLMYGLTEAFRSTYLDPRLVAQRGDSIGTAIPNNEVLVLRPDGSRCEANEAGELVHRGALVALGYWNAPELTAQRFKPLPVRADARAGELPLVEMAVWSGDIVRMDEDGYLYYIGRLDEQIKVSGYRVSPGEVEQVLHQFGGIGELAVVGVAHPLSGQALIAVIQQNGSLSVAALRQHCQNLLPAYMVPAQFEIETQGLPRNANGKIDRQALRQRFAAVFMTPLSSELSATAPIPVSDPVPASSAGTPSTSLSAPSTLLQTG